MCIGSPLGALRLIATDMALAGLYFPEHRHAPQLHAADAPDHPVLLQAAAELAQYFRGARREFAGKAVGWEDCGGNAPAGTVLVKDVIADAFLQQILTRPAEYDVIATLNLNGDYLSDALAAQVGGIGIAPGGNINYTTGHAVFEATHGTAPKYADLDKVNPGSVVLSGEMMLRYLGWTEAADLVLKGMDGAIAARRVTYDFARLMEGATEVKTSEFGDAVIAKM